jgi:D-glycero-alpha-D-manno-heptose-7-phosphate kinase
MLNNYTINLTDSVNAALKKFDQYKLKSLIVVDSAINVVGTLSEGDIRRFAIKFKKLPNEISEVMQEDFFFVYDYEDTKKKILKFDLSKGAVPIVTNSMSLVDVYDSESIRRRQVNSNILMSLTAIAPGRVSLGGGGSDVADWFKFKNGLCINVAINKYARVYFTRIKDEGFIIESINQGSWNFFDRGQVYNNKCENLILNCLRKFPSLPNLKIQIYCDFDIGSGLGGSSSLCVALLAGCARFADVYMTKEELKFLAYQVERVNSGILGGWQDQIASSLGGLIRSSFSVDDIKSTKIHLSCAEQEILSSSLFLFRVGLSRESSAVHAEINSERTTEGFNKRMLSIIEVAEEIDNIITERKFNSLGKLLDKGWRLKRQISPSITNDEVDSLYSRLLKLGAGGGRLLGAGASGYLMMFVPISRQADFVRNCSDAHIAYERLEIDMQGVRILGEEYEYTDNR